MQNSSSMRPYASCSRYPRNRILTPLQHQPRQLLLQAIAAVKDGVAPSDDNALDVGRPLLVSWPVDSLMTS
jgi:hypothetical protein